MDCPSDISSNIEMGSEGNTVRWKEPSAIDLSGNVSLLLQTHSPGDLFTIGSSNVIYMFDDFSHNTAVCSFVVSIKPGKYIVKWRLRYFKSLIN